MRVAVVQHDIAWQDAARTTALLEARITAGAGGERGLVVLTEMFATGFSMDVEAVAEPVGGPIERWLVHQAESNSTWIVGSIAQWAGDGRAVNVAVLADPHGRTYRYEKIHPFTYSGEHEHYQAGDKPLTVDIDGVRTSIFICYDLRFADDFWALAPGTDLYVVVANWPEPRREQWRTLLRARAIENQAYVIGANRVGKAGDLNHTGDSAIIDPLGRTLVEGAYAEMVLSADISAAHVDAVRDRMPFLSDRR